MVTMTNAEATVVQSPLVGGLMQKNFPVKDAYWMNRFVKRISDELTQYNESVKEILEDHKGTVKQEDGRTMIVWEDEEEGKIASDKINELAAIEISIPFKKVVASNSWPDLTLAEMAVLELFVDFEKLGGDNGDMPADS